MHFKGSKSCSSKIKAFKRFAERPVILLLARNWNANRLKFIKQQGVVIIALFLTILRSICCLFLLKQHDTHYFLIKCRHFSRKLEGWSKIRDAFLCGLSHKRWIVRNFAELCRLFHISMRKPVPKLRYGF